MSNSLSDAFNVYFDMVHADNELLKREAYRLRYQVYCLETRFLPDEYPDGLEKDSFDDSSAHCLIRHRRSEEFAATVRLILPHPTQPETLFPIETHCIIDRLDVIRGVPRTKLAEVSRFCVSKSFKRRQGESGTTTGVSADTADAATSADEKRTFPHITLALIACLVRMSCHHGMTHWYAVMEPALIRFLTHFGIYFSPIGPLSDYHGKRQPCIIEVKFLLDGVAKKNPDLWAFLTDNGRFTLQ
ncbi:PEP-CTERM/exosortase system-associated acyltransferase [Methylococcus sp. EFPC2]|uniref:PEP-CTERM/exosortase system-associated acyltransferase n=1 Tax=Methylococcus sp. EFPC2 TaxID=2812648 RepID=UPI0019679934|nr:PEP-CTERM/exosortase system-associated acyltransferase [Methylococcus sp. EFPC2]QSA96660.1 PEP-CTERM/exosortase system-associated acyltransferase [Methylococcus sp. EFPC2]